MIQLALTLLMVLGGLIVSGLFFTGRVWSPTVTAMGYRVKISIAVPQVAFSFAKAVDANAPAPPSAK